MIINPTPGHWQPAWCRKEGAHAALHVDSETGLASTPEAEHSCREHAGLAEAEAEGAAYVLASMANLDTSDYSVGYVTTWTQGDVEAVRATASHVLDAVHRLAPALEQTPDDTPHDEPEHVPEEERVPQAAPAAEAGPGEVEQRHDDPDAEQTDLLPAVQRHVREELDHYC
ncbi:MAG: hypothetical protein ACRDQA_28035, partial [Nocardioidaceae bacterium]